MPLEKFIDRTEEIGSWTLLRETYRFSDKDAMGEMRMMERYAGVKLGIWDGGPSKATHKRMEDEAQRLINEEIALPREQKKHMRFMLELLTEAQSFISSKGLGTKPYHQVELLFKFMANFGVDGPVENIIASNGCTPLFHSMLGKAIRRAAWYGLNVHDQVSSYAVSKGISTLTESAPTLASAVTAAPVAEHDLEAALASLLVTPPPAAQTTATTPVQATAPGVTLTITSEQMQALAALLQSAGAPLLTSQQAAAAATPTLPTQAPPSDLGAKDKPGSETGKSPKPEGL